MRLAVFSGSKAVPDVVHRMRKPVQPLFEFAYIFHNQGSVSMLRIIPQRRRRGKRALTGALPGRPRAFVALLTPVAAVW
jgi:hypothetical protein